MKDSIDSLFAKWDRPGSPGAAVVVMKDGKIAHSKGYGYSNLEYDVPITPDTVFHVASVSKQFTAMAVAILAKEGRISLDDEVKKYIPEMPEFGHPITIRHLLHHVSGLKDQWELLTMAGWRMDDVITMGHLMKIITHQKELNFEPGFRFLYSNSGYTLLAVIVQRVSGMPFPDYMQKTIFEPLGMNNSHIHYDHQLIVKNKAESYAPKPGGTYRKSVLNYANFGATSLFTTVEDLAKWLTNYAHPKIGGPEVISQMKEGYTLTGGKKIDYGFGIISKEYRKLKLIYHTGSDAGFRAYVGGFPEIDLGVVILSNVSSFPREPMAMKIADLFIDEEPNAHIKRSKPRPKKVKYLSCPGTYLVKALGKLVDIRLTDKGLTITMEGWDEARPLVNTGLIERGETLPQGEFLETDVFATEDREISITFVSQEVKEDELMPSPYQILINTYGEELGGLKIEVVDLKEEDLREYVGTYFSEELGTAYTLFVSQGYLIAGHRRHEDAILIPSGKDQFHGKTGPLSRLDFLRDEKGNILGFKNTGNRAFNVRFHLEREMYQDGTPFCSGSN